jgi:hypothetical protein
VTAATRFASGPSTAIPVMNELAKPTSPAVTQNVPQPQFVLSIIAMPIAKTTPPAGEKILSPTSAA